MDSLFWLKNIEIEFNRITFFHEHEMTKKEKEECESLVDGGNREKKVWFAGMGLLIEGPTGSDESNLKIRDLRLLCTNADSVRNKLLALNYW